MVRLPRRIWLQLAILAAVTLIAGGVMAFGFVNVPALVGIGRYNVTLELPASGGLYPTSVVTYRGSEIGRVTSIDVTPDGVQCELEAPVVDQDPLRRVGGGAQPVGRRRAVRGADAERGRRHVAAARRRRRHTRRQHTDPARYRWPAGRHKQGVAGDPARQSQDRGRRSRQGGRGARPGTVPHRRRIDIARERCSQEPGLDHPADRPVASGAQLPSADGGFDRSVGGSDVVGHRVS